MLSTNEDVLKKIDPLHYFEQFILEEVYPDGRDIMQFRPTFIEMLADPAAYGSSYVQQGGACVSCTVSLSVAPNSDEPFIVYELKALECIQKEVVDEANMVLSRIIQGNYLLDADSLRINQTENSFDLRFTLHLEIAAISADGALADAVLTAVQAAILNTQLPRVDYTGRAIMEDELDDISLEFDISKLRIHPLVPGDKSERRLVLKDFLTHVSFLFYSNPKFSECRLLCDASAELCAVIASRCHVTVGGGETIYTLTFSATNDVTVGDVTLAEITKAARRRHAAISAAVERCQRAKLK